MFHFKNEMKVHQFQCFKLCVLCVCVNKLLKTGNVFVFSMNKSSSESFLRVLMDLLLPLHLNCEIVLEWGKKRNNTKMS